MGACWLCEYVELRYGAENQNTWRFLAENNIFESPPTWHIRGPDTTEPVLGPSYFLQNPKGLVISPMAQLFLDSPKCPGIGGIAGEQTAARRPKGEMPETSWKT